MLQDQRIVVRLREEDRVFAESLGRWVLGALDLLGTHLQGLAAAGSDDEEPEGGLPAGRREWNPLRLRHQEFDVIHPIC